MNILGIETSCDETSCAVVKNGKDVLSNITVTSLKKHSRFGGIIPEIASRHHLETITLVMKEALKASRLSLKDIHAVAVTSSPGLIGSLLVGISFARGLAAALKKPLVDVDHIKAHLYANFLRLPKERKKLPRLPAVGLIVSGGHTSLYAFKDFNRFRLLGQTLDDAAGEAFDKTARILKLGYPGGPVIDKLASQYKKIPEITFKCAAFKNNLNFSFSGIKTAVLYHTQKHKDFNVKEIAKAFQTSVVSVLVKNAVKACQKTHSRTLVVGGGVAANSYLREQLSLRCEKENIRLFFPPLGWCLDNAAMIAGLGYHQLIKKRGAKKHVS